MGAGRAQAGLRRTQGEREREGERGREGERERCRAGRPTVPEQMLRVDDEEREVAVQGRVLQTWRCRETETTSGSECGIVRQSLA